MNEVKAVHLFSYIPSFYFYLKNIQNLLIITDSVFIDITKENSKTHRDMQRHTQKMERLGSNTYF